VPENTDILFSSVFLDKNPPADARIDEMLEWGKKIYGSGANPAIAGNLSFRTKMGFIITGSGLTPVNATKDSVVEVRGVVFGLNRPSVYAKGQVAPAEEALLHSVIYEALLEINAIFFLISTKLADAASKSGIPSTNTASPAGSRESAQEIVNQLKTNNMGSLIINDHAVIITGKTMSDAGQLVEKIQSKSESGVKSGSRKK
jgi:ribulose-5-phosphate 4-epimerase/fuculose-1-phosphate aldolase